MENAIALFQIRIRRTTRRWGVEERFVKDVIVTESATETAVLTKAPASGGRPWQPAGTLAATAEMAWQYWSTAEGAAAAAGMPARVVEVRRVVLRRFARVAQARPVLSGWASALRELVRGEEVAPVLGDGLARLVSARTQWLPLALADGALVVSWGVAAPTETPFPWAAVYLSVLAGSFSGRLRVCRLCEEALFVAAHPWGRTCGVCGYHKQRLADREVRRILDRLRKQPDASRRRREAVEALRRGMPLGQWRSTWGKRRGPQGRKPGR